MRECKKRIRIFLLDEHLLFTQVVQSLLDQSFEFEVVGQAQTILDGIPKICATKPDIVLMDYQLPDGTGIKASSIICKKLPSTKIIFLTIEKDHDIMKFAMDAGINGYVLKETGIEELLKAIDIVLEGKQFIAHNLQKNQTLPRDKKTALLSKREKEIAILVSKGLQSSQIAIDLHISEHTVTTHRKNIMRKLDAHSSMQLAKIIQ
jgi:DNA-binding NarL/FixJ family response regulator